MNGFRNLLIIVVCSFLLISTPAYASNYNITDHGGPILNHTTNLHLLFWGPDTSFDPNEKQDVTDFIVGLPNSSQMHLVDGWMRGLEATYTYVSVDIKSDQQMPPAGKKKGTQLQTELHQMWPQGDPNGLYIVVSANYADPSVSAWHDSATVSGMAVPVIYIPDQTKVPGATPTVYFWDQWLDSDVPGGKTGSVISLIATEIAKAATDPFPACSLYCNVGDPPPPLANPAWYDASVGAGEVGDGQCLIGVQYTITGTFPNYVWHPHYATMTNGQRFLLYSVTQPNGSCAFA